MLVGSREWHDVALSSVLEVIAARVPPTGR